MKMQSKYFFVPSPPLQVWRKCSSTEQPVSCSTSAKSWEFKVKKIEKKKIRDKERCGKGDSGSLRFPRPGHSPPSDGENSDYCRTRVGKRQRGQTGSWVSVVRGPEEKATCLWWLHPWADFAELYLPLKQQPSPWKESTHWCSPGGSVAKILLANQKTRVWPLGWEDPPEEQMETRSSILDQEIPWTEEPGRLQSMGPQRVGHDWATEHGYTGTRVKRWDSSTFLFFFLSFVFFSI